MVKQISIVLETNEDFDELELVGEMKKFLYDFRVEIVGTHIKVLKPVEKKYGKDIQSNPRY